MSWTRAAGVAAIATLGVAARDLTQKKHALLRNYPVLGHGRYLLETIGPELRQYIVTSNDKMVMIERALEIAVGVHSPA